MLWATSATSFSILIWFSASLVCVGYNLEIVQLTASELLDAQSSVLGAHQLINRGFGFVVGQVVILFMVIYGTVWAAPRR